MGIAEIESASSTLEAEIITIYDSLHRSESKKPPRLPD
jgi:hypothetical protein